MPVAYELNRLVSCGTDRVCVKRKKYFSGAVDTLPASSPWSSHLTTYQFLHSHLFFQARIFDLVEPFVLAPCNEVDEAKKTFVYLYQTVGQKSCVSSGTFSAPPKCRFRGNLFEGHSGRILYRIDEQVSRSIDLLVLHQENALSTQAYQKPFHCNMILGKLMCCYWCGEWNDGIISGPESLKLYLNSYLSQEGHLNVARTRHCF
jgi:hypothetical protein